MRKAHQKDEEKYIGGQASQGWGRVVNNSCGQELDDGCQRGRPAPQMPGLKIDTEQKQTWILTQFKSVVFSFIQQFWASQLPEVRYRCLGQDLAHYNPNSTSCSNADSTNLRPKGKGTRPHWTAAPGKDLPGRWAAHLQAVLKEPARAILSLSQCQIGHFTC